MELRQVRYFQAVARAGHFRAAAASLNVAQPALSQQIRQLERQLGVTLFDRNSRYVRLTPAGELFLARAERILADVEGAEEEIAEFRGLGRGRLRLGSLYSLGIEAFHLPELLAEFRALYPGVQAAIREEAGSQLYEWLQLGEIDLAFTLVSAAGRPPAGIALAPLFTERLVVLVAANHRLAGRGSVWLGELSGERFIVFPPGSASRDMLASHIGAAGLTFDVAFEVSENLMLRALAGQNLGIAVVPGWCFKPQEPPIVAVELKPPRLELTLSLAWAERFSRSPAALAFFELACRRLAR